MSDIDKSFDAPGSCYEDGLPQGDPDIDDYDMDPTATPPPKNRKRSVKNNRHPRNKQIRARRKKTGRGAPRK